MAGEKSNEYINKLKEVWCGRFLALDTKTKSRWKELCEFLCVAPPVSPYPALKDIRRRSLRFVDEGSFDVELFPYQRMKFDPSPWIVPFEIGCFGVPANSAGSKREFSRKITDNFQALDGATWELRNDTFPGNLALFVPSNFEINRNEGGRINVRQDDVGVRGFSSAALTSKESFLFGRFDAVLRPPKVKGIITGIFLHRDTPRQEIDIEFLGNNPCKLLANVYYNPGIDKSRFDYGYRGTPVLIDLGFDTTKDFHKYSIEWTPDGIRWYVDDNLVYKRSNWEPTPIPHLPMKFHINLWPSMAHDLVGRIDKKRLPTSVDIQSISLSVERKKTCFLDNTHTETSSEDISELQEA